MTCAEYGKATHDDETLKKAKDTYRLILKLHRTTDRQTLTKYGLIPKIIPETRMMKSLATPLSLIGIAQELREVDSDPLYTEVVDGSFFEIEYDAFGQELFGLGEAEEIIRQIQQENPDCFEYIKDLPDGVRSAKHYTDRLNYIF